MAPIPPHRPGQPYGGAEELTPIPVPDIREVPVRLVSLEKNFYTHCRKLDRIIEIIDGPDHDPEKGIRWVVIQHSKRHRFFDWCWRSALVVIIGAAVVMLGRIAYIVQSAKLP